VAQQEQTTTADDNSAGAADAAPELTREQALEAEIEALRSHSAAVEERAVRLQAEAQNMIRRAERDVENARKYALERFTSSLLPTVDNLERALAAAGEPNEATRALIEGVQLTHRQFLDVLQKFDVVVLDPKGASFNPELHQAMSIVESPDAAPNTVIAVMQKGYTLHGRLVRPAMVVVAKAAPKINETA
jgi:molecular chaperone GrpE